MTGVRDGGWRAGAVMKSNPGGSLWCWNCSVSWLSWQVQAPTCMIKVH